MATKARLPETERHWLRVLGTSNEAQARVFVAQKALAEGRGAVDGISAFRSRYVNNPVAQQKLLRLWRGGPQLCHLMIAPTHV
jgi:hypothetical protein